ncbi:MAG: hypothetical protein K0U34_07720 [Alphaproteobacteria bacterium]|nr:hypothetical protein [Alphaproteobacteria bacterium]
MRILVALACLVLGTALLAGFIYRDGPQAQVAVLQSAAPSPAQTQKTAQTTATPAVPKIMAPKAVGEIADAQPTILNADRTRFQSALAAPEPMPVTQKEDRRARRVLVMALQGELRRVGCYKGPVNGTWQAASKSAMYWFLKQANAKLPVSQPEHAQLNLLKAADKDACAKTQPTKFVTKVEPAKEPVETASTAADPTAQDPSFAAARQRAGLPADGRVGADGEVIAGELPVPMAVGRIEAEKKQRRAYRVRDRRIENLFKHPLNRY